MIAVKKLDEIVKRIVEVYQPEKVILFGSYANGTAKETSDIDLLLVKQTDEVPVERAVTVRRSLRGFLFPMDILVYTPKEIENSSRNKFSFVSRVLKSGKILYDKC
ncbi:MAG: nucleotidyltransferase domain-containing protein [Bacteroidetes bacterium]|nr:nucleotidyltransferase domain-containing protein [Bacteroidota bacterium]